MRLGRQSLQPILVVEQRIVDEFIERVGAAFHDFLPPVKWHGVIPFERASHRGHQIGRTSQDVGHVGDLRHGVRRGERQILVGEALEDQEMVFGNAPK